MYTEHVSAKMNGDGGPPPQQLHSDNKNKYTTEQKRFFLFIRIWIF